VDEKNSQIIIENERYDLDKIKVIYRESKLYSYLEIKTDDQTFIIKSFKSIWEHIRLSTYDVIEKREDNKVYNFYCYLNDLGNFNIKPT
jgi:hypothetical protein